MSLQQMDRLTHSVDIPWKTFVKESNVITEKVSNKKIVHQLRFSGDEAKTAYEEIISQTTSANVQFTEPKHAKSKSLIVNQSNAKKTQRSEETPVLQVTANTILKAVEQKDLNFLLKHVTFENVNVTDEFGWTPLMSAAYCGHFEIVKFLLSLGANSKVRDRSGFTAAQLALKRNYLSVVALLRKRINCSSPKSYMEPDIDVSKTNVSAMSQIQSEMVEPLKDCNSDTCKNSDDTKGQSWESSGFYCKICKASFSQSTPSKHETSTLHIFNTKPKLPNTMYGISKQNKGYQMLLNTGWDEQDGLGPSGKGMKYPIKTCLKMDRKGLGQTKEKDFRVTHFKPGDITAIGDLIVLKQKNLKKRDREKLLNREARKMKNEQEKVLKHIEQVEEKAGEILTDRQEIVALDKRRNDDRVGMRALQNAKCKKAWITVGPLLLKMPSQTAQELLVKDQRECDIEINKLRSDLKVKVNELRDLELNPPVPGLMLKPLSHKEMSAMKQVLGQSS